MADPAMARPGEVICHNDVCPENVVYRDGGRWRCSTSTSPRPGAGCTTWRAWRSCRSPWTTPEDAARTGRGGLDPFARLRVVADAYGLRRVRRALVDAIERNVAAGGAFLQRRVDRGEEAFLAMRDEMGGHGALRPATDMVRGASGRFFESVG